MRGCENHPGLVVEMRVAGGVPVANNPNRYQHPQFVAQMLQRAALLDVGQIHQARVFEYQLRRALSSRAAVITRAWWRP